MNYDTINDEFTTLFLQELQKTTSINRSEEEFHTSDYSKDIEFAMNIPEDSYKTFHMNSKSIEAEECPTSPLKNGISWQNFKSEFSPKVKDSNKQSQITGYSKEVLENSNFATSTFFQINNYFDYNTKPQQNGNYNFYDSLELKHNSASPQRTLNLDNDICEDITSEKILSLDQVSNRDFILIDSNTKSEIKINVSSCLVGRFYVDQNTFNWLNIDCNSTSSQNQNFNLFCYRRNHASIRSRISFFSEENGLPNLDKLAIQTKDGRNMEVKKIRARLNSSLRRKETSGTPDYTVINETEDFVEFLPKVGTTTKTKENETEILNNVVHEFHKSDLPSEEKPLNLCWDQFRFKSATANNRHDATNKYYVVFVILEFVDICNNVVGCINMQSKPIIVRGRNPRFYSKYGDILISKTIAKQKPSIKRRSSANDSIPNKRKKSSSVDNVTPINETIEHKRSNTFFPDEIKSSLEMSSYQYHKVDDNYYLPPVEVGYFPHHVHHNKQVFKNWVPQSSLSHNEEKLRRYNYFM